MTLPSDPRAAIRLCPAFRDLAAPGTGRRVVQLTEGEGWTYPLYFFIPSFTRDNRYLVYHRAERGELQLHRLELATGESRQLTFAHCTDTQWRALVCGFRPGSARPSKRVERTPESGRVFRWKRCARGGCRVSGG